MTDADKSRRPSDPKNHARTEPIDRYRSHSVSEGDRRPVRMKLSVTKIDADKSFDERKAEEPVTPEPTVTLAVQEDVSTPGTPSTAKRRTSITELPGM